MPVGKKDRTASRKTAKTAGALTAKKAHEAGRQDHRALLRARHPMLAWLESKRPNAKVASSILSNDDCLLARFLHEHGYPEYSVGGFTYGDRSGARGFKIPRWFDRAFDVLDRLPHGPITAATAIRALRGSTP